MTARVHHLDVCTMCPRGGRLVSGDPSMSVFSRATMVAHALVVETQGGLVLVDTGIGLDDVADAGPRLGRSFVTALSPCLDPSRTAARQIEALGYSRRDVRHVVLTHLDVDHAGGLPDFPHAEVHVHRAELDAALARATRNERQRYRACHFAHGPRWVAHEPGGDRFYGLESVRALGDDVVLVPLVGHTRGHSAVCVRAPAGASAEWLVHCGDAYFYHGELDDPPTCPPFLAAFQSTMAIDDYARRVNVARLRELRQNHDDELVLFSAHCPRDFERARASTRDGHA